MSEPVPDRDPIRMHAERVGENESKEGKFRKMRAKRENIYIKDESFNISGR